MNYEDFKNLVPRFSDRAQAGRELARELEKYGNRPNTIVAGLPRGGVVTAAAIADALDLPLEVIVVRKLGAPGHEELAIGAIAQGGVRVLNFEVIAALRITPDEIEAETKRQERELARRERMFRGDREPLDLRAANLLIIDDGLGTGSTMEAAIAVARRSGAAHIVAGVPISTVQTYRRLRLQADDL
ncbi:MAG TPA: phosphoribosyltransferase family protein, partial [Thermoanaerobaculia bacterium]|nr:phosphoribosyltransferase family protein [Thermoanaerobaculia bacterium]